MGKSQRNYIHTESGGLYQFCFLNNVGFLRMLKIMYNVYFRTKLPSSFFFDILHLCQIYCKFDLKTPFFLSPVISIQTFVKLRKLSTYTCVSTINYPKIVCKTVSVLKVCKF